MSGPGGKQRNIASFFSKPGGSKPGPPAAANKLVSANGSAKNEPAKLGAAAKAPAAKNTAARVRCALLQRDALFGHE